LTSANSPLITSGAQHSKLKSFAKSTLASGCSERHAYLDAMSKHRGF
jgi:hypothetical protein